MVCKNCKSIRRVPLHCFLGKRVVVPPEWANIVCWHKLTECERDWFNEKYPSVFEIIESQCEEWEYHVLRKLQIGRDKKVYNSCDAK